MEWSGISYLLTDVYQLYKENQSREWTSGRQFNLFAFFRGTRYEHIHSDFIAELLNPLGSHGQGNSFLTLFLKNCLSDGVAHFESWVDANVQREFSLGSIDTEANIGGRVDIYVRGRLGTLYIENKIGAGLQDKQLERYLNECIRSEDRVIFLTLFSEGHDAVIQRLPEAAQEKLIHISYQHHILKWLNKCKKEVADNNVLREAFNQYIYCVKQLTNTIEDDMTKTNIVSNILNDFRHVQSFMFMDQARNDVFVALQKKILNHIDQKLAQALPEHGIQRKYVLEANHSDALSEEQFYTHNKPLLGINYTSPALEKYQVLIRLEFDRSNKTQPFVGLSFYESRGVKELTQQQARLLEKLNAYIASQAKPNSCWLYWTASINKEKYIDFSPWIYESSLLEYLLDEGIYSGKGFAEDMFKFIEQVVLAVMDGHDVAYVK